MVAGLSRIFVFWKKNLYFLILPFFIFVSSCSSSAQVSPFDLSKLDPPLQILIKQRDLSGPYDIGVRRDGSKEYGVIIQTSNSEELRSLGIQIGSVVGGLVTARITIGELEKVARLHSVKSIQASKMDFPHN